MYSWIEDPQQQERQITEEGLLSISFDRPINIKGLAFPIFSNKFESNPLSNNYSKPMLSNK